MNRPFCILCIFVAAVFFKSDFSAANTMQNYETLFETTSDKSVFQSKFLKSPIVLYKGVFQPYEAESNVLPVLKEFDVSGMEVYEIGTGSGIIALYLASQNAKKVVATDINPQAILSAKENARSLKLDEIIEIRLVSEKDMSAFAVVQKNESFDFIVSNPPYTLDLLSSSNSSLVDKGDLGLSIIDGLEKHLRPDGKCVLYYNSLFYHLLIKKYAESKGYKVQSYLPDQITPWEFEILANSYLDKFLKIKEKSQLMPNLALNIKSDKIGVISHSSSKPNQGWWSKLMGKEELNRSGFLIIRK